MRLSEHERHIIREATAEVFGPGTQVMLFGSRVDDAKRGGDIDLFVEASNSTDIMMKKIRLAAQLQMRLGEQKIDIVVASDSSRRIEQEAHRTGVVL